MFGGEFNVSKAMTNEFWVFNLTTMAWSNWTASSGAWPTQRNNAVLSWFRNGDSVELLLFSGWGYKNNSFLQGTLTDSWIYNVESRSFRQIVVPPDIFGRTNAPHAVNLRGEVFIFGGWCEDATVCKYPKNLNDLIIFNGTWTRHWDNTRTWPQGSNGGTMVPICDGNMVATISGWVSGFTNAPSVWFYDTVSRQWESATLNFSFTDLPVAYFHGEFDKGGRRNDSLAVFLPLLSKTSIVRLVSITIYPVPWFKQAPFIALWVLLSFTVVALVGLILLRNSAKKLRDRQEQLGLVDISVGQRLKSVTAVRESLIEYDELEFVGVVGVGGYGVVSKALWAGTLVAVKEIPIDQSIAKGVAESFQRELYSLFRLRHPNVLTLYGLTIRESSLYIVTEWCENGDLFNYLIKTGGRPLPPQTAFSIAIDIARGLQFLHAKQYVHRDLKSMNCLLTDNLKCKVGDLGLTSTSGTKTSDRGTLEWQAPEVMAGSSCTHASDVYAFGIILWEIFSGEKPFSTMTREEIKREVISGYTLPIPDHINPEVRDLIERCWRTEPIGRPNVQEIADSLELTRRRVQSSLASLEGQPGDLLLKDVQHNV